MFYLHDLLGRLEGVLGVVLVVVGDVVVQTVHRGRVLHLLLHLLLDVARHRRQALHLLLLQQTGVVGRVDLFFVQFVYIFALVLLDVDEVGDGHVGGGPLERGFARRLHLAGQFLLHVLEVGVVSVGRGLVLDLGVLLLVEVVHLLLLLLHLLVVLGVGGLFVLGLLHLVLLQLDDLLVGELAHGLEQLLQLGVVAQVVDQLVPGGVGEGRLALQQTVDHAHLLLVVAVEHLGELVDHEELLDVLLLLDAHVLHTLAVD